MMSHVLARTSSRGLVVMKIKLCEESSEMSADISPLAEEDIPGASLRGRNPQQLTIPELKRRLSCRKGAETNGNKRNLVER